MDHECQYEATITTMKEQTKLIPAIHEALVGKLNGTPGLIEQTNRNTWWRKTVMKVLVWIGGSFFGCIGVSLFVFYLRKKFNF